MKHWDPVPPPRSELGDHDVRPFGQHLAGKRVALMVSGGIAAIKAPFIARALRKQGADVVAYCSREALRYTTEDALVGWCKCARSAGYSIACALDFQVNHP